MGKTAQYSVAMADDKLEVVFVLGSPGSGKGTVCKKIEEDFGYVHFSGGELLRQERAKADSPYKDCIKEHFRKGLFIPPDIMFSLLETAVANSKSSKFLFDAFPISMHNLDAWHNTELSTTMTLRFVLFLDCPQEVCETRILIRGAAGSGRDDDVKEKLENRFKLYKKESFPVVEHFETQKLLRKVDASKSPDDVYHKVRCFFQTGVKE
jgi:UMP-CMP kinase